MFSLYEGVRVRDIHNIATWKLPFFFFFICVTHSSARRTVNENGNNANRIQRQADDTKLHCSKFFYYDKTVDRSSELLAFSNRFDQTTIKVEPSIASNFSGFCQPHSCFSNQ